MGFSSLFFVLRIRYRLFYFTVNISVLVISQNAQYGVVATGMNGNGARYITLENIAFYTKTMSSIILFFYTVFLNTRVSLVTYSGYVFIIYVLTLNNSLAEIYYGKT